MGGDFNARSELWGDRITDKRAESVIDWAEESGLVLINEQGGLATFETVNGKSWIDLT